MPALDLKVLQTKRPGKSILKALRIGSENEFSSKDISSENKLQIADVDAVIQSISEALKSEDCVVHYEAYLTLSNALKTYESFPQSDGILQAVPELVYSLVAHSGVDTFDMIERGSGTGLNVLMNRYV